MGKMARLQRLRAAEEGGAGSKPRVLKAPKSPAQCRRYLRKRLTEQFPEIVDEFVKNGKLEGTQRMRFIAEILNTPEKAKTSTIGTRTLSRWAREMREGR